MAITNLSHLLVDFGHYPPERIRLDARPGRATEKDVLRIERKEGKLCELIYGVLVEKTMGFNESLVAAEVTHRLKAHVNAKKLGVVASSDGSVKLFPGQIRFPDSAYYSWDQLPGRKAPKEPIPELFPDLAIEVLSEHNTQAEMKRKLKDYFFAGTKLVWYIDPDSRTAQSFTAPDQITSLTEADSLRGEPVLPGFVLPLAELFAAAGV